jgi:hypothetical protein
MCLPKPAPVPVSKMSWNDPDKKCVCIDYNILSFSTPKKVPDNLKNGANQGDPLRMQNMTTAPR